MPHISRAETGLPHTLPSSTSGQGSPLRATISPPGGNGVCDLPFPPGYHIWDRGMTETPHHVRAGQPTFWMTAWATGARATNEPTERISYSRLGPPPATPATREIP